MTISIHQDEYSESPREWNNLGTIVASHHRYNLSDVPFPQAGNNGSLLKDFSAYLEDEHSLTLKDVIYLPVYLYDHSGISINSTGFLCSWDSGQVGFIYVTKQQAYSNYSVKRINSALLAHITARLNAELESYDHYISGNCYEYRIYDDEELVDACSGFLGDFDDVKKQMRGYIGEPLWEQLDAINYDDIVY